LATISTSIRLISLVTRMSSSLFIYQKQYERRLW
jgi:hypothetical protein